MIYWLFLMVLVAALVRLADATIGLWPAVVVLLVIRCLGRE